MRSPTERALWTALAVVVVAAAAAAWWTAERWTPHAEPWARQAWRTLTRPSPPPGHPRAAAAAPSPQTGGPGDRGEKDDKVPLAPPRKCVQGGRTVYTDRPCPPGSEERPLDPALSVLPQ